MTVNGTYDESIMERHDFWWLTVCKMVDQVKLDHRTVLAQKPEGNKMQWGKKIKKRILLFYFPSLSFPSFSPDILFCLFLSSVSSW